MEGHAEVLKQILADVKAVQALLNARIEPRLLSMEQAATYIGRSRKGIEHLIAGGAFAVIRSDSRVFIDRRELDAWIDRNRQ